MRVLLIFIDGVGIGEQNPAVNPLARFPSRYLSHFKNNINKTPHDGLAVETDPTMDMPGLPQSATGQTAIFTGENAAQIQGRHLAGYPSPTLRALLEKESIFLKVELAGKKATFANAFTPQYLERPPRGISASTWAAKAASFPLRMVASDLQQGKAVMHDLTNQFLRDHGVDTVLYSAETAAKNLCRIASEVDFCLFEYFITDMVGHQCDWPAAEKTIATLDTFIDTVLASIDPNKQSVVITSDHGNLEDLSTPVHTRNNVATQIWGPARYQMAESIGRIEHVAPAILSFLKAASV